MRRIAIPALLVCALFGTNVQAQKTAKKKVSPGNTAAPVWKEAYNDAGLTVSVDPRGTSRLKDGSYSTHLRWTYAADQAIGRDQSYRTMIETRVLDCDSLRSKPVRATTYTQAGKKVSSYDTKPSEMPYLAWTTRKPGSTNANALAGVCQTIKKKA